MYQVEYNYHDSIVRLIVSEELTVDEIESLSQELCANLKAKNVLLLTDVRGVKYGFDINDIEQIIEMTGRYINPDTIIYEAILINTPLETAKTILFDISKERNNHICKIFSTEPAALNWLMASSK